MKHANVMNLKTGKGRGLGTASDDLGSALNPANALWNVALGLATPLLNRDALDADVKIATDCKLIFLLKPPYMVEPLYAMVAICNYPPCFNRTPPPNFHLIIYLR